ncbi:hypothetical protein BN8_03736 [Fibrisoma limi BUZ 3]|uniref:Uncharacterized protein n=1 Tax=Fibrisoma limi BUZ 3 TaxID=1185876 RepID=I2GKX8_9BACT|nr:hypothetical protein BN8_03736 [Fibrisoma limi BUZ 3]
MRTLCFTIAPLRPSSASLLPIALQYGSIQEQNTCYHLFK